MRTTSLLLTIASSAIFLMPLSAVAADSSAPVTRAEFVQILVEKFYDEKQFTTCFYQLSQSKYKLLFRDVDKDAPYAKALCVGMLNGFVRGYSDGTFRPNQPVNLAEAAKLTARVLGTTSVLSVEPNQPWYRSSIESLTLRNAIPASITTFDHVLTREEMIEMLTRLESGTTSKPSPRYIDLERATMAKWKQR